MSSPKIHPNPCDYFADRLVDLSDGELSPDERIAVEAHVANCASCREQLQRLDISLAALRTAVTASPALAVRRTSHLARTAIWIAVGSTAATILLAVGIASFLKAPTIGRGELAETAAVEKAAPSRNVLSPGTLTTGQGFAGHVSTEDALRQIALLEQQARLETSLALMPDDPWFAEQRATNERLLSTFREASAAGVINPPSANRSRSKDTL